ncbi:MAG: PEP/pyruvate-binding domain-containing protein [Burkholderiales bacterium]|jgi:pyruvate,water dikinase
MSKDHLLPFPGCKGAGAAVAGGKGASLIALAAAGFSVPAGVVIAASFFAEWSEQVQAEVAALTQRASAPPSGLQVQALARELPLTPQQQSVIQELREGLPDWSKDSLLAVRSSAPWEDGAGASFAGAYLTRLGVRPDALESALRDCFAALYAPHVAAYQQAMSLDGQRPGLALVVQRQLDSEVAGVAFSMNPLNNDADEALITANWGQGESVVAGEVDPDQWCIDRRTARVLTFRQGSKRSSRWLEPSGGLVERRDSRADQPCLSDARRGELLALLDRVEQFFGHPVDIEWAWANGQLWLLQARPVSTHLPLAPSLMTSSGEPRRLYLDLALSSGLTLNAAASPMGLDVLRRAMAGMGGLVFPGWRLPPDRDDALLRFEGGRMYLELSNLFWVSSPQKLGKSMALNDASTAKALEAVDANHYRSARRPQWARWRDLARLPAAAWRLRRLLTTALWPMLKPQQASGSLRARLQRFEQALAEPVDVRLPLSEFWRRQVQEHLPTLLNDSLTAVAPAVMAMQALLKLARGVRGVDAEVLSQLERGVAGNVVVAMSLEMHKLANTLARSLSQPLPPPSVLAERLANKDLPEAFLIDWTEFTERHGCRGPMEMDVACPRYADDPALALAQIVGMPLGDASRDPQSAVQRQITKRQLAMDAVLAAAGPVRRALIRHMNQVMEAYMGLRDTPKHHFLMMLHGLRHRLLAEGEALCAAGRLERSDQVFALTWDELALAAVEPSMDLQVRVNERQAWMSELSGRARDFPALIDSRGRILRPPPAPASETGLMQGQGLSSGRAKGQARTLRSAQDGPLKPGEILIAYTTDPGWTPLFVNAAAVVLEIGGPLQHGAVVARELGLPCVAGIGGVSRAISDGQWLEVDGASGTVRLVHELSD